MRILSKRAIFDERTLSQVGSQLIIMKNPNNIGVLKTKDFLSDSNYAVWDCSAYYDSEYSNKIHFHEFYELSLIYEGSCIVGVNGTNYSARVGFMQLSSPVDYHVQRIKEGQYIKYINIVFTNGVISPSVQELINDRNFSIAINLDDPTFVLMRTIVNELLRVYNAELAGTPLCSPSTEYIKNYIENICILLVDTLLNSPKTRVRTPVKTDNQIIKKIFSYIRDNYKEDITLNDVAEHVTLSYGYLSAYFTRLMGENLSLYLLHYRLSMCAAYIRSSDLPFNEIAYSNGFRTFPYFSTAFKKYYGMSPREYRTKYHLGLIR